MCPCKPEVRSILILNNNKNTLIIVRPLTSVFKYTIVKGLTIGYEKNIQSREMGYASNFTSNGGTTI